MIPEERLEDRQPTVVARIPEPELTSLLPGYGYHPVFVSGSDPAAVHRELAGVLDNAIAAIRALQDEARSAGRPAGAASSAGHRPRWPMIVFRTPKGWTGPKVVDGLPVEGTWRAHQVPLAEVRTHPEHLRQPCWANRGARIPGPQRARLRMHVICCWAGLGAALTPSPMLTLT